MCLPGRFSSGTLPLDLAHSGTKVLLRKVCEHPFLSQNLSTGGSATPFREHPGTRIPTLIPKMIEHRMLWKGMDLV